MKRSYVDIFLGLQYCEAIILIGSEFGLAEEG
jgi:hypothetical protein